MISVAGSPWSLAAIPGSVRVSPRVLTPATADALARDTLRAGVPSRVPLGRWGRPSDLAGLAVYLASAASEYHTGDVLTVDGGYGSC